jgi:hypothetical protein
VDLSAHIDQALRRAIDAGEIPGVVAAVATDREVIYQGAFGKRELMGQNHIGDLCMTKMTTAAPSFSNDVDLYPDIPKKWGLGFMINTAKTPEGRSAGSMTWAGLANTYYWTTRFVASRA